jgi:hypothetical protein
VSGLQQKDDFVWIGGRMGSIWLLVDGSDRGRGIIFLKMVNFLNENGHFTEE